MFIKEEDFEMSRHTLFNKSHPPSCLFQHQATCWQSLNRLNRKEQDECLSPLLITARHHDGNYVPTSNFFCLPYNEVLRAYMYLLGWVSTSKTGCMWP
jgi:hypothetical protein